MGHSVEKGVALTCALLCLTAPLEAQERSGPGGFVGVTFLAADAMGDFGSVVDQGFGLEIGVGAPMAAGGHLRIRGDLGFLVYGLERIRYCEYGCRLATDLTTTNSILFGDVGPELVLLQGPIEPYVHASAGLSWFVTSSSLEDYDGYGPYLETTNYTDVVFGWKYGGGLRVRVGGGHKPVFLDFGVERFDHGITDYLTRGDIVDHPDGSVTIYPNRSEADLLTFRFGVSVGIGGR